MLLSSLRRAAAAAASSSSSSALSFAQSRAFATGTCKWFSGKKGFGFIKPDAANEPDLFCHQSGIQSTGFRFLNEGERVTYDVEKTDKGPQAANVRDASGKPFVRAPSNSGAAYAASAGAPPAAAAAPAAGSWAAGAPPAAAGGAPAAGGAAPAPRPRAPRPRSAPAAAPAAAAAAPAAPAAKAE